MKVAVISDSLNKRVQEEAFRAAHVDEKVIIVNSFDELKRIVEKHRGEMDGQFYVGGTKTPIDLDLLPMFMKQARKDAEAAAAFR